MIRNQANRTALMAAAVLLTGATAINCSNSKKPTGSENAGSVGMAIVLSPGINVNAVGYSITGGMPPITPITGSINVTGTEPTVSLLVSGIPAGVGYVLALNATSTDSRTTCAGSARFNVIANQTTGVSVTLECRGPGVTGGVVLNGRFDNCPVVALTASPLQTGIGGPISLAAAASDLDGDVLTFAWTSSSAVGTFGPANAATSTFTCTTPGTANLTVSVSDGRCTSTQSVNVTCAASAGTGGSGSVGGAGGAGTGGAATGGATATGGAGTGGAATGGATATGGAGTGGAATGGATATGGAATGGATATGGAGTGGAATGGATATGGAGTGGAGTGGAGPGPIACPTEIGSAACNSCTTSFCDPSTDGCCGLSNAADIALCNAAATCFRDRACTLGGDPTNCFCGLSGSACSTAPTGVCLAEIQAAARSTDPGTILSRFVNATFPIGRAVNMYTCRSTVCPAECPAP